MLQNVPNSIRSAANTLPLNDDNSLHRVILSAWRERRAIALICGTVFLLATIVVLVRSPTYTARAIVQISSAQEPQTPTQQPIMVSPTAATDAATFIGSESLAHRVVVRLGLDKLQQRSWMDEIAQQWQNSRLNNLVPITYTIPTKEDAATKTLMKRLSVKNEPRSNIVTVDFISRSSLDAARIANAVVAEYVDAMRSQRIAARAEAARTALTNLRMTYGDQHPSVISAKDTLDQAERALRAEENRKPPDETELAATGYVVPARPNTLPSGLGSFNILGVALIFGLFLGILYAAFAASLKEALSSLRNSANKP
ncbi:MAG: Wzz/FepE/Etk N-terminal domain-containing protein [Hyphomicrobium sp.]